jgi:hypothetical protein
MFFSESASLSATLRFPEDISEFMVEIILSESDLVDLQPVIISIDIRKIVG